MRIMKSSTLLGGLLSTTTPVIVNAGRTNNSPFLGWSGNEEVDEIVDISNDGFTKDTSCMNTKYQIDHTESLQCLSSSLGITENGSVVDGNDKFWKQISLKAPPSCVDGRRLKIDELEISVEFYDSLRDFAVSCFFSLFVLYCYLSCVCEMYIECCICW